MKHYFLCRVIVGWFSVWNVREKIGDGFAVVGSSHGLREHHRNIDTLKVK